MAERISDAEWAVMEVLWNEAPLTAQEVSARTGRDWSDRTVKTMLSRLLAKGALSHEEEGRRYLYRPAAPRGAYVASETRRLLGRLFGGRAAPLVAHLAEQESLSEQDAAEIAALLRELKP